MLHIMHMIIMQSEWYSICIERKEEKNYCLLKGQTRTYANFVLIKRNEKVSICHVVAKKKLFFSVSGAWTNQKMNYKFIRSIVCDKMLRISWTIFAKDYVSCCRTLIVCIFNCSILFAGNYFAMGLSF